MSTTIRYNFETGATTVVITPDGYIECAFCNGSGTVEDDFWGSEGDELVCQECNGEGLLPVRQPAPAASEDGAL